MFVLHSAQYTCGRFALPQSRHRCTSVTKSILLNWFLRFRLDGVTFRFGTAIKENISGVPGDVSKTHTCSSGTTNSGSEGTEGIESGARIGGRLIESTVMLPLLAPVGRINVLVHLAVDGGGALTQTPTVCATRRVIACIIFRRSNTPPRAYATAAIQT